MMDNNISEKNYERIVLETLLSLGYPENSIVMEARLDSRCLADLLVNDINTGIPLMVIEVKACSEKNRKLIVERAYESLKKYYYAVQSPVKAVAAICYRERNTVEFIDFTEAIKENNLERMVRDYTLPPYKTLTVGAKRKAIDKEEAKQEKRINILKLICWGIFPAICMALLLLDAFEIYTLSVLRLTTIGAGAIAALIPCFKEIKIGEISLKNQVDKQNEDKKDAE